MGTVDGILHENGMRPPERGGSDGKYEDSNGSPDFWEGGAPKRRFTMGDEKFTTAAVAAMDDGRFRSVSHGELTALRCASAPDLHNKLRSVAHGELTPSDVVEET